MIEIKFDSANEVLMLQYMKDLINKNPILLQNILEPTVNGIISDANIPEQIKTKINEHVSISKDDVKDTLEEMLHQAIVENDISQMANQSITNLLENDENVSAQIDHAIETAVSNVVDDSRVDDIISDKVCDAIDNHSISEAINSAVDDIDMESLAEQKLDRLFRSGSGSQLLENVIREHVTDSDIISDRISEKIDNELENISITNIAESYVQSECNTERFDVQMQLSLEKTINKMFPKDRVIELIRETVTNLVQNKPEQPSLPKSNEEVLIQLSCNKEDLSSVVTLLEGFKPVKTFKVV